MSEVNHNQAEGERERLAQEIAGLFEDFVSMDDLEKVLEFVSQREAKARLDALVEAINMTDDLDTFVKSAVQSARNEARLEEAEWWQHLVPLLPNGEGDHDKPSPDCMYCQRIEKISAFKKPEEKV